jgi:hypothetical protein
VLISKAFAAGGLLMVTKGYLNTFRPEVKHVYLKTKRDFGLPDLKILHLSDIHIEKLSISAEKVKRLTNGQRFDLIALTGDYLDRPKSINYFLYFLEQIASIPTRFGIYAVWGNHDWVIEKHLPFLKKKMEEMGVEVLDNRSVSITHNPHKLHIIGIDDHHSGHDQPNKAFAQVPEDGFRLVLTHDPALVRSIGHPFDYLLCGHLHSGQIYYPLPIHSLTWGFKPFRHYLSGLHYSPYGPYYINAGLGQTGPNLRIGCRPELTIHHIIK